MRNGTIPPDKFSSLILQALMRPTLLPNPQIIEMIARLERGRHEWREGIEDRHLDEERTARLERIGSFLVVASECQVRLVSAVPGHIVRCFASMGTALRIVVTYIHK